jgi:hypothetical protein
MQTPGAKSRISNPAKAVFDPDRALTLAKLFAFPRRSGSQGNERAAQQIQDILGVSQIEDTVEPFRISRFPKLALQTVLLVEALLLLLRLNVPEQSWPLLLLLVYSTFLLTLSGLGHSGADWFLSSDLDRNVITEPIGDGGTRILLIAHPDSKSQPLPIVARMAAFFGLALALLICIFTLVTSQSNPVESASISATVAGLTLSLGLVLQTYGNRSPGVLDNGSGVAVLLALAERLKHLPLPGCTFKLLFSGAEEIGLQGASRFVDNDRVRTETIINIDMVGAGTRLWVYGAGRWQKAQVRGAAQRIGQPVVSTWMPLGMLAADPVPFFRAGRDALSLTMLSGVIRYLHTTHDGVELLDIEAFRKLSRLLGVFFEEVVEQ